MQMVNNCIMQKIVLFISAFVPMYILFLINLVVEIINSNLTFNVTNSCVFVGLIILTLIGTIGLVLILKYGCKDFKTIKVIEQKNITDQHFLNYFSLFVLLALAFDLSKICFVCVFIVIIIFIGIVYIKNSVFYINPLLNILGYSFYDISYKDKEGNIKDCRIFFKGNLKANNNYDLCISNKNLNFLKEKTKQIK